jgi:hypothetical protein
MAGPLVSITFSARIMADAIDAGPGRLVARASLAFARAFAVSASEREREMDLCRAIRACGRRPGEARGSLQVAGRRAVSTPRSESASLLERPSCFRVPSPL